MPTLRLFAFALLAFALGGCGGSDGDDAPPVVPPPADITITLGTATPTILVNQTAQFQATVTGTANTQVTYSVDGSGNGSISATGLYTAPDRAGVFTVRATAAADPARSATATITVTAPPAASGWRLGPNVRIAPGTTTQFTAFLNDQPTAANWAILGACEGCSINSTGLFTAGNTVQTATVQGSNPANPAQVATALVTIATEVILTLTAPAPASLTWADMLTFNATISPEGIERGVSWTTNPPGAGQVFNVDYFFGWAPPAAPGAYTLTAASVADPGKTGSFSAQVTAPPSAALAATTGAPASMRYQHAAAAMPDGRVVIVGGVRDRSLFDPLRASEIFNAVSGTFSGGPTLAVDRIQPEAVAIDANRVLVTGGREDWNLSRNTAEVLDLATGSASAAANAMSARRIHHQMVRLATGPNSGKVLVLGGFNGPVPYGDPTWLATASADLFDPAGNAFAAAPAAMKGARGLFTATALADGRILIVGGYSPEAGTALASAEIYDPVAGTFSLTGSMATARYGHSATRLADGKVLIVGGDLDAATPSSAELYDPASGSFSTVASKPSVSRIFHAAAAQADGRVLIFGGESGNHLVRGTVEAYDPATQGFSLVARMGTARARATATPLTAGPNSGKVLVFGGGARDTPATAAELSP